MLKRKIIIIALSMITMFAIPQMANATCWGGCNYLDIFKGDKGDTGDTGATGAKGMKGDPGIGIKGDPGNDGIDGLDGLSIKGDRGFKGDRGDRGWTMPATGMSLAIGSGMLHKGGIALAGSVGGGVKEFSLVGAIMPTDNTKLTLAFTHADYTFNQFSSNSYFSVGGAVFF